MKPRYRYGEFPKMAKLTTGSVSRSLVAVSLSALLGACALDGNETVQVQTVEPVQNTVQQRFVEAEEDFEYTSVVPRAAIDIDDINETAPETYTVVRGDTLWDISARFLKEPWLWPTVWDYNPQIANPHLIYPGDQIALEYVNGQPTIVIERDGIPLQIGDLEPTDGGSTATPGARRPAGNPNGLQTVRLSPRIRSESLNDAVPMISADSIRQFLVHPRVVSREALRRAPYVVGHMDNRLTSSIGHIVYARGRLNREQPQYSIFRRNDELRDPVTNELLGYEVVHVANAKLLNLGDPSTLGITNNKLETITGDLLLPNNEESVAAAYTPRLPEIRGEGRVISLVNAITQTGRDQAVVINLGERSGIQIGDVLAVEAHGGEVVDRHGRNRFERVKLPNSRTGVVMIFKTFEKVSYGLIMESTRPVNIDDVITGI